MDPTLYGWIAGVSTLTSMLAFLGVVLWSFNRRRHDAFESAARLPLEEDGGQAPGAQP